MSCPARSKITRNLSEPVIDDFPGQNCCLADTRRLALQPANAQTDNIEFEQPWENAANESNPGVPGSTTPVEHRTQTTYVGSLTPGQGIAVSSNTLQYDHATGSIQPMRSSFFDLLVISLKLLQTAILVLIVVCIFQLLSRGLFQRSRARYRAKRTVDPVDRLLHSAR